MADRWGYGVPSSGYSFPNLPATSETWSGLSSSSGGAGSTSSNQHQRPAAYGMDRGTSPYACSECGYSFYSCTTEDITRHMLSHISSRQSPATSSPTIGQSSVHSMYAGMQGPVTTAASNGVSSMNSLNSYPYSNPNAFPSAYPLGAFPGQQRTSSSAFPGQEQMSQSAFPGHDRLSQRVFPGQDRPSQSAFPGYDRPSPSAFPGQERSPPSAFPGQERSPPSAFPGQERSSQSTLLGKEPPSQSAVPAQNQPSPSIFPGQSPPQSVFPGQQPPTAFPGQIPSHYNHPKPPPLKPAPHIQQQLANRQKELDNRSIIESIYSYPIPKSNETIPVKENKLAVKPKENSDNSKSIENDLIPKPKENDKKTETIPEQKNSETKPEKPISVIKPSLSSILGIGPRTVQTKVSEEKPEKNETVEKIETSTTSENNGNLKQQKRADIDESGTSNSSEKDEDFSVPPKKMRPDPDLANSKPLVLPTLGPTLVNEDKTDESKKVVVALPTLGPTLVDEDKIEELKKAVVNPLKSLTRELTTEEILQEKEKEKEKGSNEVRITPFAHMNKDKVRREKSAVLNFFPNKSKKKAVPKAPPKAKPKPKKTNFPKITSPTPVSERGSRRAKSEVNYAELDDPYAFTNKSSTPKPQPSVANQEIKDIVTKNIKSPEAKIIKSPVAKIIKSPVQKRGWTKSKGYADYGADGPDKVKTEASDDSDSENGDGASENTNDESQNANNMSAEANGETKVESKVKLDAVVNQFSDHPLFSILGGEEEWNEQAGEAPEPEQDDHIDLSNFLSTDMPAGVINPNGPRHKAPAVFTSNPTEWGYPEKPSKDYAGKRYQCDYCDYGSSELTNIKTHIRGHTGEKPYKCSVCNFRSSRSNSIKMHMRTHTGEKPFKCDLCGKAFTKSSNLIVHRKTHTGEKDYKCALCGDAFITPGELKKHIRCHTGEKPYQCKHCEQCFSDSSTLQRHTKTHTGEKPYECDICGKTFTRGDTLTHHRRTHTGEKPYKCSLCPKAYIQSCRLKQHMMKDHFAHLQQQALNETQDTIARAMGEQGGGMANAEADLELLAEKETQEIMSAAMKTYDPTAGQKAVYTCTLCPKSYIQSCRLKSHFLKDHLDYLQQQAEDVIEEAMRKGREREEAGLNDEAMEERKAETKSEEPEDTESHLEQLALQATENLIANAMETEFYETDGTESQIKTENNADDGVQIPSNSQMEADDNKDDGSQIKNESTEVTQDSEANNTE